VFKISFNTSSARQEYVLSLLGGVCIKRAANVLRGVREVIRVREEVDRRQLSVETQEGRKGVIVELPNKEEIKARASVVFFGEAKELDLASEHYPAGALISAIKEIDGVSEVDDGWTCNGWEWDWWREFDCKGVRYTLSGSGYYGGHKLYVSGDQPYQDGDE